MMFFLPEPTPQSESLKLEIEQNGGIVIYIPECCCFQITTSEVPDLSLFQKGHIYRAEWIQKSIRQGHLLAAVDFVSATVTKSPQISFSRSKFTIREILKIFEVVEQYPSKRTKNPTYWNIWMMRGCFPGRSVHSINAQWQRFSVYSKEDALKQGLKMGNPYCVSFREAPTSPQLIA